jgi:phosphohistidine phosphatase
MTLYIVRHGRARKGGKDRLRPLTERGIRETRAAADFLKRMGIRPRAIWHSDRVRAIQTARLLKGLRPAWGLIEQPDMGPADSVGAVMRAIKRARGDVMIVGHLPHLGKLVAKLIGGNTSDEILGFPPSTIVVLSDVEGKWCIEAVIPPAFTKFH